MKHIIRENKSLHDILTSAYGAVRHPSRFSSKEYWEKRYAQGGLSGSGSYGRLGEYKAEFLNSFVRKEDISSVIEFGCGDGAQLGLFEFRRYIGLDVSKTSISLCMRQYADDESKSFYIFDAEFIKDSHKLFAAELSLSLDVIYHLVEDHVFEPYMHALFNAAQRFVIIYASNTDQNGETQPPHVRHRKFTDWVEEHEKSWKLVDHIVNRYSLKANEIDESFADFYIYSKANQ